jgi:hypothetical protein
MVHLAHAALRPVAEEPLRLQVQSVDQQEYLVAELIDCLGPMDSDRWLPRWSPARLIPRLPPRPIDPLRDDAGSLHDPNGSSWTPFRSEPVASRGTAPCWRATRWRAPSWSLNSTWIRRCYVERLPHKPLSAEHEPLRAQDLPWHRVFVKTNLSERDAGPASPGWRVLGTGLGSPDFSRHRRRRELGADDPDGRDCGKEASDALRDADRTLRRTISSVSNLQDQLARSEAHGEPRLDGRPVSRTRSTIRCSYILSNLSFAAERCHRPGVTPGSCAKAWKAPDAYATSCADLKTLSRLESEDELKR